MSQPGTAPLPRLNRLITRSLARRYGRRTAALPQAFPPTVSFTVDDVPASTMRHGLPILAAAGFEATWYVSAGLLGRDSPVGPIASASQIGELHAARHEIGDHTYSHLDARLISAADYASDVARNRSALTRIVPGLRLRSFAYPFGQVTLGAKRAAGAGAVSCRSTIAGIARDAIDLGMLPALALYSRSIPIAQIEAAIGELARDGGWLIFYTHDVCEQPSEWGCTPAYLAAAVSAVGAAGLRVRTVGAVAAEIGDGSP